MGDNRDNSSDSRVWGTVDLDLIKGTALIVWWSRGRPDGWDPSPGSRRSAGTASSRSSAYGGSSSRRDYACPAPPGRLDCEATGGGRTRAATTATIPPMTATHAVGLEPVGAAVERARASGDLLAQRVRVGEALVAVLRDHLEDDGVDRRRDGDLLGRASTAAGGSCFMWKLMMSIGLFARLRRAASPVSISYAIMPSA